VKSKDGKEKTKTPRKKYLIFILTSDCGKRYRYELCNSNWSNIWILNQRENCN